MLDVNQVLYGITVIASLFVIGGGAVAIYVYWSWRRFASGNWTIRSISFYPEAKNIKIEQTMWMEAAPGETLPLETLSIKASEDDPWTPVGLTRFKFTGTINPPAVLVYFVIINPNLNPAVVKEIVFTVKHLGDERIFRFIPTHFAEKGGIITKPGEPVGLQFKAFWGSLLVRPASCSAHRLALIPELEDLEFNLVAGEYECAIEFVFESLFKIVKMICTGKRRIAVEADIDKDAEETWKRKEPVILPPNRLLARTSHVKRGWRFWKR
ncbi:MAG: hypothetical protein WBZ42_03590 [Halobacteriota archaeon]